MPHSQCAIHNVPEEITEQTYRVCGECWHVWTAEELVKEFADMYSKNKRRTPPPTDPEKIFWCPLCLHDF